MKVPVNTTIEKEKKELTIKKNIKFNEALEFGIRFLLSEKYQYDYQYPNSLLKSKFEKIIETLNEKCQENEILKEKLSKTNKELQE